MQNHFNLLSIGFIQTPVLFLKKKDEKNFSRCLSGTLCHQNWQRGKIATIPQFASRGWRKYMNPVRGPEPFWLIKLINFNKRRTGGQETFAPGYPTKPLNYLYRYFQLTEVWKTQIPAKHKQGRSGHGFPFQPQRCPVWGVFTLGRDETGCLPGFFQLLQERQPVADSYFSSC